MPKSTTTAAPKEAGTALLDTLYKLVESELGFAPARSPNKSGTYTRLLVDGKAFAYVFPPAGSRLAVKVPKQLLAVEGDLPKGHGFKRTKWGLTRSVTKASEVPVVAKSLTVAAARVRTPVAEPVSDAVEKLPPATQVVHDLATTSDGSTRVTRQRVPQAEAEPQGAAVTPNSVVIRDGAKPDPKPQAKKRGRAKQTAKA